MLNLLGLVKGVKADFVKGEWTITLTGGLDERMIAARKRLADWSDCETKLFITLGQYYADQLELPLIAAATAPEPVSEEPAADGEQAEAAAEQPTEQEEAPGGTIRVRGLCPDCGYVVETLVKADMLSDLGDPDEAGIYGRSMAFLCDACNPNALGASTASAPASEQPPDDAGQGGSNPDDQPGETESE